MVEYVVAFAFPVELGTRHIPMILKNKPVHLKGVLNLPGGKIERGESVVTAAVRELKEETGLDEIQEYDPVIYHPSEEVGIVYGWDSEIHVVAIPVSSRQELTQISSETEPVDWYNIETLQSNPKLMPNLRLVIPLIQAGYKGWEVVDRKGDFRKKQHTVELYLNTGINVGWEPIQVNVPGMDYYGDVN